MGNFTFVVAALSYAGQLNLAAVADRETCPDVEVFAQGVQATLNELEGFGACADFLGGSQCPLGASQMPEHS